MDNFMLEGFYIGELMRRRNELADKVDKSIKRVDKEEVKVKPKTEVEVPYIQTKPTPYVQVVITGEPTKEHKENFSKVRFPAVCLYGPNFNKGGFIVKSFDSVRGTEYSLYDLEQQHEWSRLMKAGSLLHLYNRVPFSIEKAKIIIKRR
jgi:hypothetical protein